MSTITQKNVTIITRFHSNNGQLSVREFLVDGKRHRDPKDGPAYENWYSNGQPCSRQFWVEGKRHRDPKDGLAYESFHSNGQLAFQEFWVEGKQLSQTEVDALLKPPAPSCEGKMVIVNGREYVLMEKK